ncbi:MAG: Fur family transcriptional regulator [Myxococcales bacterium]
MATTKRSRADALAAIKDKLRSAGLKGTAPRIAVLRWLESAQAPVSHGELAESLSGEGFDRATLYRNLMDMTEAGLVSRTDLGDHVWRFALKTTEQGHDLAHPHFTCTDCGTVACLPEVEVKVKKAVAVPRSLTRQSVQVQIRGRCDDCE